MKSTVARLRKNCPICAQKGGYWSHLTEKSIRDYVGSEGGVGAPSVSSDAMYKKYICEENVSSLLPLVTTKYKLFHRSHNFFHFFVITLSSLPYDMLDLLLTSLWDHPHNNFGDNCFCKDLLLKKAQKLLPCGGHM